MAPLRVLALCGYSHNASIFSQQVRKALLNNVGSWSALPKAQSLQVLPSGSAAQIGQVKAEGPATEVVFLDPTVVLTKEQLMPFHIEDLARYKGGQEVTTPRAWWTAPDRATYGKYDETLAYLHQYLSENAPFDGVIGFSQGAAMAAALAALLEKPGLHPAFPQNANLKPLKFAIAVGGFKPRSQAPDFSNYFPIKTPVLHVLGKKDAVVSEKASKQLVDACENSRVEYHEGGHAVPTSAAWREFFNSYITTVGNGGSAADVAPLAGQETARL